MSEVTPLEIERLVREVLAQLAPVSAPTSTTELWLEQAVVTMRDLEHRLAKVQSIVVPPRAVLTPAARDYLREQGVGIRESASTPAVPPRTATLLLGVAETNFEPTGLIEYLARHGIRVERIARTGLKSVVAELSEEVAKGGRRGWLLTDATHAAVCLANRTHGVWACAANHRGELQMARKVINVNLIITRPQQSHWLQLAQVAQEFARQQSTS